MTGLWAHLLESTLFAGVVWLTTLALSRNHARTRHALWVAASVKFLIPFWLFVGLGSYATRSAAPPSPPAQMRFVMADTVPPRTLSLSKTFRPAAPASSDWRSFIFGLIWFFGCAGILIRWYARWRSVAAQARHSVIWNPPPGMIPLAAPVRCSTLVLEPCVFGIFRPVLLLPAGIEQRLSAEQLQAVFAHELSHIRRRDNLAAAIHMFVEAIFWFHPLVWWMGSRLVEERERACDEEALQLGSDRAVYAESILRVCQFCLESPAPCISGIRGADLKQRIANIMTPGVSYPLGPGKKLLLAALGVAAIAVPLAIGLVHPAKLIAEAAPQVAAPLEFNVASLKLAPHQDVFSTRITRSVGHVSWKTQLIYLVSYAYDLAWWRISGDTTGFGSIYEVDAITDPHATDAQIRLMIQSLLKDRFNLVVHRVTKEVDGYALTVTKGGPKMQEAKEGQIPPLPEWERTPHEDLTTLEGLVLGHIPEPGVVALVGRRVTVLQLTETLQRSLNTAVLDQTGLTGKYYFGLEYANGDNPDAPFPNLSSAVKELGLRLDKHKGPVEILVVDHIDKTPAEN